MNRTLVCAAAGKDCVSFRTSSRNGKSPHWFYILRDRLADLERGRTEVIAHDIHSFAVLDRDIYAGTIDIRFFWLSGNGDGNVSGYQETVTLPYDRLAAFIRNSLEEEGPSSWKALSVETSGRCPKLVFEGCKNLHDVINNEAIRRKLVRFIRDNFNWPQADKIIFYNDFVPYSFCFREYRHGRPAVVGGLILHSQDDPAKSYYAIHT